MRVDPYAAIRRVLLDESSVTDLLLPQARLAGLLTAPVFALTYPRKVTNAPATGYTGHDWAALLQARAIDMLLISPSGRAPSGGDTSRAPWSRPRFDLMAYGRSEFAAMRLLLTAEEFLKNLSQRRAVLPDGTALVYDVTVEGGPIPFPDPDTEAPVAVGIYAATVAEQFVSVA